MTWKTAGALSLCAWIALVRCSDLERDNPVDPVARPAASPTSLSLTIGLSKILLSMIHRVEAILVSAEMDSVVKELDISPLGPATGTIGTIPPGSGYALSLVGYDLDGNELFRGVHENITIIAGDTTAVSIDLEFIGTTSESGGAEDGSQQPAGEGSSESEDQSVGSGESEGQSGSEGADASGDSGAAEGR